MSQVTYVTLVPQGNKTLRLEATLPASLRVLASFLEADAGSTARAFMLPVLYVTPPMTKSLLLSHHHSTSALVSKNLTSVLQTVQKKKKLHMDSTYLQTYRRQCAKYTYIYSVHTVYYKDILSYRYALYTVCTHLHYVHIYT